MFFIALIAVSAALLARQNSDGNVAAGEAVFFGKGNCSSCHEINGRGGIVGPDLSAAGTRTPDALRAKILNPNAAPGGRGGGRTSRDGRQNGRMAARFKAFAATKTRSLCRSWTLRDNFICSTRPSSPTCGAKTDR